MSFLIKIAAQEHLKDILSGANNKSWHEGYLCALVDIGALTENEYSELMEKVTQE